MRLLLLSAAMTVLAGLAASQPETSSRDLYGEIGRKVRVATVGIPRFVMHRMSQLDTENKIDFFHSGTVDSDYDVILFAIDGSPEMLFFVAQVTGADPDDLLKVHDGKIFLVQDKYYPRLKAKVRLRYFSKKTMDMYPINCKAVWLNSLILATDRDEALKAIEEDSFNCQNK